MSVAPTGPRGKAKLNLRDLLAESATFQTAIGATGTTEEKIAAAKLRLHRTAYEPTAGAYTRPFGLIVSVGNDTAENDSVDQFAIGGDIEVRFERAIAAGHVADPEAAETDFENFYEGVMDDAMTLSIQSGKFAINSWQVIEGPEQIEIESGAFICTVRLLINWGLTG